MAMEQAHQAVQNGNYPFGAVLVSSEGAVLLHGQNTVITANDCTKRAGMLTIDVPCTAAPMIVCLRCRIEFGITSIPSLI